MKLFLLAPICLLLVACGEQQLQLETRSGASGNVSTIGCQGQTLTGVTVVVHKADGKVLSQHQTDSSGKLDIPWADEARHVTLAYLGQQQLQLQTILSFAGGRAGTFTFNVPDNCACKTITLNSAELQASLPEYQLFAGQSLTQPLSEVQVCQDQSGQYPALELLLAPRTVGQGLAYSLPVQTLSNNGLVELKLSEFALRADPLSLQTNLPYSYAESFGLTDDGKTHFKMRANGSTNQQLQLINQQFPTQRVSVYRQKTSQNDNVRTVSYLQRYDIGVSNSSSAPAIAFSQQETALAEQVVRLQSQWRNEPITLNVAATNQYTQLHAQISGLNSKGRTVNWSIQMPLQTTVPLLQLPDNLNSELILGKTTVTLKAEGYANGWNEQQLRGELADLQSGKTKATDPRFANYRAESATSTLK